MKKILLILFITIISCNFSFSQLKYLCQVWQLQNPSPASISLMIGFTSKGEYTCVSTNLSNYEQSSSKGTFILNDHDLTIKINNDVNVFILTWYSTTKMSLNYKGYNYIYAVVNSSDDHFMENLLNNSGKYSENSQSTKCYTCYGSGKCQVCKGSGYYSAYGYGGKCTACNGSGKCWHCNGSGNQ